MFRLEHRILADSREAHVSTSCVRVIRQNAAVMVQGAQLTAGFMRVGGGASCAYGLRNRK
jgi:hypothetical protein